MELPYALDVQGALEFYAAQNIHNAGYMYDSVRMAMASWDLIDMGSLDNEQADEYRTTIFTILDQAYANDIDLGPATELYFQFHSIIPSQR